MGIEEKIDKIRQDFLRDIDAAGDSAVLENVRVKYLGRKGFVAGLFKEMGNLSAGERPQVGAGINRLKNEISASLDTRRDAVSLEKRKDAGEEIDITLPGIRNTAGHLHPLTQVMNEICEIFVSMGFEIVEGPEIETEFYNFDVLNIPPEHPSRNAFDTFYLTDELLLRSHTSPVQGRVMEKQDPPLRVVVPGKTYRPDAVDATHSFMFHQIEGFMVDKEINFSGLKGTLDILLKRIFGEKIKTRFIPHFFPFTEPSAEVEISCIFCDQKGCPVCKGEGWLEILGAGMIHPEVFRKVGYKKDAWTGFAFGMGVERIAMLKYGIKDIRLFYENDMRFLKQF